MIIRRRPDGLRARDVKAIANFQDSTELAVGWKEEAAPRVRRAHSET